ncbi:MAG: hypothetical protein ASARMPRED_006052 [Alectoria sarmentosa]|nr:MAG: hypothetical protein ASARMPRED_006052 [Alectoria sarmentosa]
MAPEDGGTSGVGAAVAQNLATRGAQIILLTHHASSDPFLVDYIDDLRGSTNNELIYAEQMDLSSLQSIRVFATKWVDNAPPRRLDMIILCADSLIPRFGITSKTQDALDPVWGINYIANFHFLSILSPAIRAQPPDRDVRIIFATCSSYVGGDLKPLKDTRDPLPAGRKYETSKLACMIFAQAFQKHLDAYHRPDKQPNNARVVAVDPGFTRTPGMRRWLTMGSLWGLLLYLITWPFWWLVLKSPLQGAQGFLVAAMEAELGRGSGGRLLRECKEVDYLRKEIRDDDAQKKLWTFSDRQIEALEKDGAVKRALAKKENEGLERAKATASGKDREGSLRIAPPSNHATSTNNTSSATGGAPSAPGIHDTLRSSLTPTPAPSASSTNTSQSHPTVSTHPLESRLAAWQSTQDSLKMNMLRRNFGIAEPVRRGMEMKICREGEWRPVCLGGSAGVGGDVLAGRDAELSWEDVYKGDETREGADFHSEMEAQLKMDW